MTTTMISRRSVLAGASFLTISFALPAFAQTDSPPQAPARSQDSFLRIGSDGTITLILPTSEMGQGTHTGQAQIIADELGADWTTIRIEMPTQPSDAYRIHMFGQMRSVGSYGIRYWYEPLRRVAAQARILLTNAAARELGVDPASLKTEDGFVVHAASNRRIAFADLVAAIADTQPEQADEPAFRPDSELKLIGRRIARLDTPAKINGSAIFGTDVKLDGMLHGAMRIAPVFRAEVDQIDDTAALAMPGVRAVIPLPRGAVVVADTWWQAKQAADALTISFLPTPDDTLDSATISERLRAGLDATDVPPSVSRGDTSDAIFAAAAQVVEADYEVPFLAHVCLEPIVCTAQATPERTELWIPTQGQDQIRTTMERVLQIPAEQLFINTTFLGGGFGRKTNADAAIPAVIASRAMGGLPVKVMWSREDDVQQGPHRQTMMARFRAALDADGRITAMRVRVSGPQMGATLGIAIQNNTDPFSLTGLSDHRYQIENFHLDHAVAELPVPMMAWRSIANSFTGFFMESFIDECAVAVGQDSLAFRLAHLADQPRMRAVLERVAEMSGWQTPAPEGVHRGLAVTDCYGSPVAEVVEIRMDGTMPRVERVHVAIDCGRAINPQQVEGQMAGSIVEALGAALRVKVTLANGRAEQSNFHDYPILRMDEMPRVEVAILDIGSPLGGVGEPAVPPLAPALTNALYAATQRRVRALPIADNLG
jgi:isoquinoline 1-oxidoreductase subunit beta